MGMQRNKFVRAVILCIFVLAVLYGSDRKTRAAQKTAEYLLSETSIKIEQSGKYRLSVRVISSGAIEDVKNVTWSSDHKKTVSVTKNGSVTARSAGKAKITAKTAGRKLACTVEAVKTGEIEKQFYGIWKDKNGNKYTFDRKGIPDVLKQILKKTDAQTYKPAGILSYVETSERILLYFQAQKGKKKISAVLEKMVKKPDTLRVYIGKNLSFAIGTMKKQQISLSKIKKKYPDRYVFLGDSRFAGMSGEKRSRQDVYIAKSSQGLKWFKKQQAEFKKYDSVSTVFIVGFGINDLYNAAKYADYVNGLNLRGRVYFCTVSPVDEKRGRRHGYTVTNRMIQDFNQVIRNHADNYEVLETYSYLMKTGFGTADGIHYKGSTYAGMYQYLKTKALCW